MVILSVLYLVYEKTCLPDFKLKEETCHSVKYGEYYADMCICNKHLCNSASGTRLAYFRHLVLLLAVSTLAAGLFLWILWVCESCAQAHIPWMCDFCACVIPVHRRHLCTWSSCASWTQILFCIALLHIF